MTRTEPADGPYAVLDRAHLGGPVRELPGGPGKPCSYVVTGYDAARAALADPRLSKDTGAFFAARPSGRDLHPALSRSMLATDPPAHTRLRALVTGAFSRGAVARLRPRIQRLTDALLDRWPAPGQGDVDVVEALAGPLPVAVVCELLGVPEEDRTAVRRWSDELFAAGRPDTIDAASHAVAAYMARLIDAKRRHPGTTLLDDLVAARDGEDRLGEDELVSLACLLLVAGHETTTNLLANAFLALLLHPEAHARLVAAPAQLPRVLDELLRFDSPVATATFRHATQPLTLAGTDITAGSPVLVAIGAANRDPRRFEAAERLDLDRDASGQLAFGHGVHRCVGAQLARAEAEIALGSVLTRFPGCRLAVPVQELRWRATRLMRGPAVLPVSV
ncbi:cytochrome P450 family protein [Streptomyces fuscigenes]|uniref:cytochrome P450 family protein n=1 Tax=Streptomyces fuscigenes TaxID=1528880 RepID=UPI001F26E82A|nr:cytochrome P450 [Streptomyces fuscigenes]MCF3962080.1 cytochrome P450 [Streptomyces fuscigenes]